MPMTDNLDYLHSLLNELRQLPKETEWVEFKCNNDNPVEIGEYISALANSAALKGKANAFLVWGVEDDSHEVVGTRFRPTKAKKGAEDLENWLIRLLNPRIHFKFVEFQFDGKPVSIICIPRSAHQPVQFQGVEFIRVGSNNKKLKDFPEKERELWRIFDVTPFEYQVAAERVSGSDVLTLLDYPVYFKMLDVPLPETRDGILNRLASDHMIEAHQGGQWDILNLGAILFASDLARFRQLARKMVRIIQYEGENRIRTKMEHEENKGYAASFEGLIALLKRVLPSKEVIEDALRKIVPMYPEIAIRELLANMIIHQDFAVSGTGPMVEVFEGRLEITNPGEPLMDTRRFLDTPPQSRNEALASYLRRIGICEERGSGVDKVVFQTEFHQLPAPLFEAVGGHTRVSLFAHKPFVEMEKNERMGACYLHACLQHVQRKQMTNSTLRQRFGIEEQNRAQVSRVINETLEIGLIRSYNPESESRKHASYVPFWA